MKCSRMLALTVSLLAACGFAGPNLLTNGTFDEGTVTQNSGSWSYMTGEGFVNPGWTCTGGIGLSVGNNTWVNGALAVRKYTLYCQKAGTFEQTFNVEEAGTYRLSFAYAGRVDSGTRFGCVTTIYLAHGAVTNAVGMIRPVGSAAFARFQATMKIDEPGAYTLLFSQGTSSSDWTTLYDNVVFAKWDNVDDSANLVVNGKFEDAYVPVNSGTYGDFDVGTMINGWRKGDGAGKVGVARMAAPNSTSALIPPGMPVGQWALFLETGSNYGDACAEQTVTVTDPGTYRLSFIYFARPYYVGGTTNVRLLKGDGTAVVDETIVSTADLFGYFEKSVAIADAGEYTLQFFSPNTGAFANGFDEVALVRTDGGASTCPATALWTGGGDAANLGDPANWECRDASGAVMANAVPGANTTVKVSGNTTFTLPEGTTSVPWRRFQVGALEHPATQWGRFCYGAERYNSNTSKGYPDDTWTLTPPDFYTRCGEGDVSKLVGKNTIWANIYLDVSLLRYDGWFYVTAAQAGQWYISVNYDDQFAFAIDGEMAAITSTYQSGLAGSCVVTEGWHRFQIICGDTWGGQGGTNSGDVPMIIYINGGDGIHFDAANFTMGSGRDAVTLGADCDWSALGTVTIAGGASLDLNGHSLKVSRITVGDYLGGTVVSSAIKTDEPVPAILDSACFWLDAADASTLSVNADGTVNTWTSKDANHVVATSTANKPVFDAHSWGFPTVDFGAINSLKDMTYQRFTNLRTVFWVIKIDKHQDAFLLGDINGGGGAYHFHRGPAGQYGNNQYTKFDSFWNGTERVDWTNEYPDPTRFLVLSTTLFQDCCSDSLTNDRNLSSGERTAGRQLSELICFNTVLSDEDRLAVVKYLQNKWMGGVAGKVIVNAAEGATRNASGDMFVTDAEVGRNVQFVKDGAGTFSTRRFFIGDHGDREVVQSEGDVVAVSGQDARIGGVNNQYNGIGSGHGVYRMDGGTLTANYNLQIGAYGLGEFIQSGGDVSCPANYTAIGRYAGSVGKYIITGGTYTSVAYPLLVAESGTGLLDVSGTGVVNAPKGVNLAHAADGKGTVYVHDGGKIVAPYVGQIAGKGTLVADGGTIEAYGNAATIVDYFRNLGDVTVGDRGLTFDVGNNTVHAFGLGSYKSEGKVVKKGSGSLAMDKLPPVDTFTVDEGTLFVPNHPKPQLKHRWSFNGDYIDSVGGLEATGIGDAISFNEDETAVCFTGDANSAGSLQLGVEIVPTDAATIEIWATRTDTRTWSRVVDYGSDTRHYFQMAWSCSTDVNKDVVEVNDGTSSSDKKTTFSNTMAQYAANTKYHISVTFTTNADGTTKLRWARRNVTTGVIEKSGVGIVPGWTLSKLVAPKFYIGHSQFGGDKDAHAIYDEVRIWHGVLSDAELTANALLGPDALPGDNVGNSLAASGDAENNYLLHRWNFNGSCKDLIGDNDGVLKGGTTPALLGNTSLRLFGGPRGSSWVDFGSNIVPGGDIPFTIELWTTPRELRNWAQAFAFGNSSNPEGTGGALTGLILALKSGAGNYPSFRAVGATTSNNEAIGSSNVTANKEYHVAAVVQPKGGNTATVTLYIFDAVGSEALRVKSIDVTNWSTATIVQNNFWIGHSHWGDWDAMADYNELRVWSAALSERQLRINNAMGPDVVPTITENSTLTQGDVLYCLDVAEGAVVDLSGGSFEQQAVSGTGTVRNGTLVVTSALIPGGDGTVGTIVLDCDAVVKGAIRLDVGDLIEAKGALDLTGAKLEIPNFAPHGGAILFARSTDGRITGKPDVSEWKKRGYDIRISADGTEAKLFRVGMTLYVR